MFVNKRFFVWSKYPTHHTLLSTPTSTNGITTIHMTDAFACLWQASAPYSAFRSLLHVPLSAVVRYENDQSHIQICTVISKKHGIKEARKPIVIHTTFQHMFFLYTDFGHGHYDEKYWFVVGQLASGMYITFETCCSGTGFGFCETSKVSLSDNTSLLYTYGMTDVQREWIQLHLVQQTNRFILLHLAGISNSFLESDDFVIVFPFSEIPSPDMFVCENALCEEETKEKPNGFATTTTTISVWEGTTAPWLKELLAFIQRSDNVSISSSILSPKYTACFNRLCACSQHDSTTNVPTLHETLERVASFHAFASVASRLNDYPLSYFCYYMAYQLLKGLCVKRYCNYLELLHTSMFEMAQLLRLHLAV